MSTSTATVQAGPKPALARMFRLLQLAEIAIGILWVAGSVNYLRQGGRYAAVLLGLSLLLVAPRVARLIASTKRPALASDSRIWVFLLGLFLPEHLASGGTVVMPHLLPPVLAAICALADTFAPRAGSAEIWINQRHRAAVLLTGFGIVYSVATTALAILKLHAFGYVGQDIGYFMQCLYTGLHGELFAGNQYHDLLYTHTVTTDFASHNQPVLFLLLPMYWVYPHAETLFVVRNICLALSAYPAYQLARYRLQPFPALIVTLAFMIAPAILFQNLYDYAPLSLVGLPLLFALLFYERRQFVPYIAALLLCLFVREDLAIVLVGMGLVAAFKKRDRKWILAPLLVGLAWGAFSWGFLLPHFQNGSTSAVESCFAYLGNSPKEMLKALISHPSLYITHKSLTYSKGLFTPFGLVLPFLSPIAFVGLPLYLLNVLGDPGCNAAIVFRHYSLIPAIVLLPGAILAIQVLPRVPALRTWRVGTVALALLLASVGTTAMSIGATELKWWRFEGWHREAESVAQQLPASAAVAVPRYMLPLTANRTKVYQSLRLLDYLHPEAEFVVIDRDEQRMGVTPEWEPHYRELLSNLADGRRFRTVYSSANFEVYQRFGTPVVSLRSPKGPVQ